MEYRNKITLEGFEVQEETEDARPKKKSKEPKPKKEKVRREKKTEYSEEVATGRRKGSLLTTLNIILGIIIVAVIVYILSITVFQIKKITVKGSTVWDDNYIIDQTIVKGDYERNALFQLAYRTILPRKKVPFVKSIKPSLESPTHLVLTVTEKKILGRIDTKKGQMVYFDDEGTIQEVSSKVIDGVLIVNGLEADKPKAGDKLAVGSNCLTALLNVVKGLKKYDIKVDMLEFVDKSEVNCRIGTIQVDLGKFEYINEKIMRLNIILPKLEGQNGVLHLENWSPDHRDVIFEIL